MAKSTGNLCSLKNQNKLVFSQREPYLGADNENGLVQKRAIALWQHINAGLGNHVFTD